MSRGTPTGTYLRRFDANPPRPSNGDAKRHDDLHALQAIVEGTARGTGREFFQSLVRHLATALAVPYAVVADFADVPSRVRTLAFWAKDHIAPNMEYDLAGTPCEVVARGGFSHHPTGVSRLFPAAKPLVDLGIDSYLGVPFLDANGKVLGHLAVLDDKPMPAEPRRLFIFHIFAARATAERERMAAEQRLLERERRYRDLYDQAPSAYVSIDRDGQLESANHRTADLLGRTVDELVGSPVLDLCAGGPPGRARAAEALRRSLAGEESSGLEIEMRRADGRPLWVSLWMKPLRDGSGRIRGSRALWIDITDRVLGELERARLRQQNLYLQEEIRAVHNFGEIVGRSKVLADVLDNVRRVAPTDASVLIAGETGTGKELIARAVHSASHRKDRPLIKVNCAALPAGLVESELFGHEKGAFSGAIAKRAGRFELADGGTIFLDEDGEIPLEVQVKLLRVLQEKEFDRVGGEAVVRADIRVIAATNRDLLQAVRDKSFREDLYYRLNVFPISLPPLRDRPEDIPILTYFLVQKFAARIGKRITSIGAQTMRRLLAYSWPGNVRELENVLERAVILAPGETLEFELDVPATSPDGKVRPPLQTLEAVERGHIERVLAQARGVIEGPHGAAGVLGLHPNTLRNRMKRLGITRNHHH